MGGEKEVTQQNKVRMDVDLEEALDIAGTGRYQIIHSSLMLFILTAAVFEMVGTSYVIPAATCDLQLSPTLKGIIASVPNVGVILTAGLWGKASDTLGRKPTLVVSTAISGTLAVLSSFMPEVISFVICKFAASLFLSSPSSLCFAFAGEMIPRKRRDLGLLLVSALLMYATVFLPLLAWGVLSGEWIYELGILKFRPWRLLTIIYAAPLLICSLLLIYSPESPKYLVAKGKDERALTILRSMYAVNRGKKREDYPVASLKNLEMNNAADNKEQKSNFLSLFKPPHVKWLALTGFLMFGIFSSLNGLFIFVPDTVNQVLMDQSDEEKTICEMLHNDKVEVSNSTICVDTISISTFQVSAAATSLYSTLVMIASLSPFSKRMLLFITYCISGFGCLISAFLKYRIVAAVAMSALQFTSLGIGPLTAYAVDLFPTYLRGSAVGALLMFGRIGSVAGATISGVSLDSDCNATFYGFTTLLFVCCALSFLLPKDQEEPKKESSITK